MQTSQESFVSKALIDSGANSNIMDKDFAVRHKIPLIQVAPASVTMVDGQEVSSGPIISATIPIEVSLGLLRCRISFNIMKSPANPIILGLPWLELHNPHIDWKTHSVQPRPTPRSFMHHEVKSSFYEKSPTVSSIQVNIISLKEFIEEGHKNSGTSFAISTQPHSNNSTTSTSSGLIPPEYHDYLDVFDKEKATILPQHRSYDCPIDLEEGKKPPFGPIYSLTPAELEALRVYIDENLANGFIRHSKSPAGAPIFFVSKKDGSLRLVVDYRGLNKITIPNKYPLPLVSELLDRLGGARVFTKLDLRGAYNLIRIRPGDEWKTAFRTRYGHFEYVVMPFGLTNAPAVFQHMANDVFREFLDIFVIIYLDDILIFSKTLEEHHIHVRQVLEKLRMHGLYAKMEKCSFHQDTVEFLGYVISPSGISMDPSKVKTVVEWRQPTNVKDVRSFLGFANFYRRFIKDYSKVALPLTELTKKDRVFVWTSSANQAFVALKRAFTSFPILVHPNHEKPFFIEADASDFALGSVLYQQGDDREFHPIAFHSRKFVAAEINYEIHDKELLAIVDSFEEWRRFLEGAQHTTTVFTDHKNLQYFQEARVLNRRQSRWSVFLSRFRFIIEYRPSSLQGQSDALSRRSYFIPKGGDPEYDNQKQVLLGPNRLRHLVATTIFQAPIDSSLIEKVRYSLPADSMGQDIINQINRVPSLAPTSPSSRHPIDHTKFHIHDGLLYHGGLLYIPNGAARLQVLETCHNSRLAGHFGISKTTKLITRSYWWPHIRKDVHNFIKSCDTCCRSKSPRHLPYGKLHPLPVPSTPWQSISMDFIIDLPPSSGYNAILVVVDRFTKMAHFLACRKDFTSEDTAQLLLQEVFRHHGLPEQIISDRGPQFIAKFWRRLFELLQVTCSLSSAHHPQTDGQSERTIQTLEQYLRCFINYQQDDWCALLSLAEFAYNNSVHTSTGFSPFYALTGYHPRWNFLAPSPSSEVPAADARIQHLQDIHSDLVHHLGRAQEQQKVVADRHRSTPPSFQVGDQVWLLRRHVRTSRPCQKLDYQRLGPFSISARIGEVAYRLTLPSTLRIHPVFHVSLLEPYIPSTIPDRHVPPPPPITIDDQTEYEVAEILDSKFLRRKLYYLVDWVGYSASERSWEPAAHLLNAPDKVQEFHDRYPNKPRPHQT